MKVTMYYDDNGDKSFHKTLRITLPKSWKTGPTSKLLQQFIETYNASETIGTANPLTIHDMHLAIRRSANNNTTSSLSSSSTDNSTSSLFVPLASDAITVDVITDRQDIFVRHGPSETVDEMNAKIQLEKQRQAELQKSFVCCVRFGCNKRFTKGCPPAGPCIYHKAPPVFHETAKFWSCCPTKKAYDFEEFQQIPGCQTAEHCTEHRNDDDTNDTNKSFLGGMDLREQVNGPTALKSIDEFNKSQQPQGAGGSSDAIPVVQRLQNVLQEFGIEPELYQQIVDGIRKEIISSSSNDIPETELLELTKQKLGKVLKEKLKSIAVDQLRIVNK